MRHYDYEWDLHPNYLLFDKELNLSCLGWKPGDRFELVETNGRLILKKITDVETIK